jgi:hypothetical protein
MFFRPGHARRAASGSSQGLSNGAGLPAVAVVLCVCGAAAGVAQTPTAPQPDLVAPPAWAFVDLACAPVMATAEPVSPLRVIGSQDTVGKTMFGPGDTIVISGGAGAGMQQGQEFFVRRLDRFPGVPSPSREHPVSVHTAGWVRIQGVDAAVATASIVRACDGILLDDYLEPFTPPRVAARSIAGAGEPQLGHVLGGNEGRTIGGPGEYLTIDVGSDQGVAPGQRYRVFRDKEHVRTYPDGRSKVYEAARKDRPMVEIGQLIVVAAGPASATVQVVEARDPVQAGDLITPAP